MADKILDFAESQLQKELPFVLYRKPRQNLINGIFQKAKTLSYVSDYRESGFVFAPFDSTNKPILIKTDVFLKGDISNLKKTDTFSESQVLHNSNDKAIHLNLVGKAVDKIKAGTFQKVVLSRKIQVPVKESPFILLERLLTSYHNAFCYLWFHPKVGLWLGATPEILLMTKGGVLTTMSLAGTQTTDDYKKPVWGKKELQEQQLVTDYIKDILKNKLNNLHVGELESIKAGQLWHLRTKISGNYDVEELGNIIQSLHPTPAVCGMPKDISKAFILEQENYDRKYYTGYLGELNLKRERTRNRNLRNVENNAYKSVYKASELYVNLRCMSLSNDMATIYVGGGITADSDPEKEWQETVNKSGTILKVLA
ncbi:chorismate-binding protein [Maribacter sp. 2210JD10-5]|uniref:chorismate-binding protein n=1 Tax=Maribacter sp. 2210JD10-5 TaxID=3386272 RepID=UPI0039BD62E5